MPPVEENIL